MPHPAENAAGNEGVCGRGAHSVRRSCFELGDAKYGAAVVRLTTGDEQIEGEQGQGQADEHAPAGKDEHGAGRQVLLPKEEGRGREQACQIVQQPVGMGVGAEKAAAKAGQGRVDGQGMPCAPKAPGKGRRERRGHCGFRQDR